MPINKFWKKNLKFVVYATLIINAVAINLNLIVEVGLTILSGIAIFSLILAWIINLVAIFFNFANLNRKDEKGILLKRICYIFLVFFFFGLFMMLFKPIFTAFIMDPDSPILIIANILHLIAYYGILGFGLALSILDLKFLERKETWRK